MLNFDFTFLWTAVNFAILYFFLKKFLFGKVNQFMEQRANKIDEDMERAKRLQEEGEVFLSKHQDLMESAAQERREILKESRGRAEKEYEEIISEAKRESARILAQADKDAAYRQEQMMVTLRNDVVSLAMAAASKVLEENMNNERNQKLVHDFLDKEGVA